jgi:carboxyl-terminal processing protease
MSSYLLNEQHKRSEIANNIAPVEQAQLLAEVIARIREEYVDALDDEELVNNAIEGMLQDLDSHSRFLSEDDYEDVRISTTGQYIGVGLEISLEEGEVRVVAPLDDTPAQRAGILPGDVVISVDDIAVDTQNTATTITRMRGRPGTPVTLDVMREGADESLHFALTRVPIHVKTVQAEYLGDGYGYIRLNGFTDNTGTELEAVARELVDQQDLRGVVLDLRNNPGGVLDSAVEVADVFLERGLIVRGKGRIQEARFEEYANPGDIFSGIAVAVLVNRGSASASEIVAGALKDHHRARIVGEQTYGKGSVQTIIPLSDGRALKLTTSHYLTPSGQAINGTGIQPDYSVSAQNATQQYRGPGSDITPVDDNQLQEALRVIGHNSLALSRAP